MPAPCNVVLGKLVGSLLELLQILLLVLTSWEALTSHGLVKVFNVALFVFLVGPAVAVDAAGSQYRLPKRSLELTAVIRLVQAG